MQVATTALLTDMNQPLGRMVGNAVEVDEAIASLQGKGPADLVELTLRLAAEALLLAGRTGSVDDATELLRGHLTNGRGYAKFREMVQAQGGDLDAPRQLAPVTELVADQAGYVHSLDTEQLGYAVIEMGGGRKLKTDRVDPAVGLEMLVRVGDAVERGQPIVSLFCNSRDPRQNRAAEMIRDAICVSDRQPAGLPLVLDQIRGNA
jgi:thymidine phosphorylase